MGEIDLKDSMEQMCRESANKMKSRWKDSIRNITLGFMFVLMTFNLGEFQYVLPIIGGWLLYKGFKDLKEESEVFKIGWYFSILNTIIILISLVIITTPLNIKLEGFTIIGVIFAILRVLFIFEFRTGVRKFLEEKNVALEKDPILGLGVWNSLIVILGVTNLSIVSLLLIPMIIYYFYILTRIYKLRYAFGSDFKYIMNEKRGRNIKIFSGYIFINIFVALTCCIFANHIILDSKEVVVKENDRKRNELINLGFPKDVLKDIEDSDLDFINNPTYIKSFYERLDFYNNTEKDLESNTIFIETKEKDTYVIEHFNWKNPNAFWRDEIEISASEGVSLVSGKLIYEKNEKEYISNIPNLKLNSFQNADDFLYTEPIERILGNINYPFKSKNNRGYIIYGLNLREGTLAVGNLINYIHYNNPIRLPYKEVEEPRIIGDKRKQQHYTLYSTELGRQDN